MIAQVERRIIAHTYLASRRPSAKEEATMTWGEFDRGDLALLSIVLGHVLVIYRQTLKSFCVIHVPRLSSTIVVRGLPTVIPRLCAELARLGRLSVQPAFHMVCVTISAGRCRMILLTE